MAAITGATSYQIVPNAGRKVIFVQTPNTADSADTIDVSSAAATGGETLATVDAVFAWDTETGDAVTATISSTTITLDAGGSTTDKTYSLLIVGQS